MKLSVKATAITFAIMFALGMFVTALINRLSPGYGDAFLNVMASIYPGYHVGGLKNGLIGTAYAALDGAVCGAILAWVYNAALGATVKTEAGVSA